MVYLLGIPIVTHKNVQVSLFTHTDLKHMYTSQQEEHNCDVN
jgi:hypothetical protein